MLPGASRSEGVQVVRDTNVDELRLVSLWPAATELLCALGLAEALVAVSSECDWPEAVVRRKPVLGPVLLDEEDPDRYVPHAGRSVFHLDERDLARLSPDWVFSRESCPTCEPAFDEELGYARLSAGPPRLVSLEPYTFEDVLETVRLIGRLTGRQARARALVAALRGRLERVQERVVVLEESPAALCLDWFDPPLAAGGWVPLLVETAGGQTLGEAHAGPAVLTPEEIVRFNPDLIVLLPPGGDPRRTAHELEALTAHEFWPELRAVKCGRVYLVQEPAWFQRPGPRLWTGLELWARLLHPEAFRDLTVPPEAVYRLEER